MEKTTVVLDNFYGARLTHVKGPLPPSFFEDVPHSHDHCEIFVHLAGRLDVLVEQNLYRLFGGEIRVYRSGELHCGRSDGVEEMEWYQISLPHAFFLEEKNKPLAPVLFAREAGYGNVFCPSSFDEIATLLREVFDTYGAENPLWQHYAEGALLRILCRLNEPGDHTVSTREDGSLSRILDVINAEFSRISTASELCERTHYSASYVNRLFHRQMGITPYQFLIAKKLNEAKKALLGGCSVTEACEYAGFNNYNNFITLFRKTFHQTPGQYGSRGGRF